MTKLLLSAVLVATTVFTVSFAQQDRQFTQYMFDRMSFNPAVTGFNGYCGTLMYRNQWDKVQDAPNSTVLNVQGNLHNLLVGPGSIGVGLSLSNDAIGFQKNNNALLSAAYHLTTVYGKLSAGFGLGLINVGFNPDWITPDTPAAFDPSLKDIDQKIGQTGFDSNIGLYWYDKRDFYVGLSMTHLTPAQLNKLNYNVARHYYMLAGFKKQINGFNNRAIDLNPSMLIKSDGATMIFDVNMKVDFWVANDAYFWTGASYRYTDGIGLMAGYGKDNFKVGYSFDIMTNALSHYGRGTHELVVSYCVFPPKQPTTRGGFLFKLQ